MRLKTRKLKFWVGFLAVGYVAATAQALTPDQVAVIVNSRSEESKAIAAHYIRVRQIPADHVLTIDTDPGETIAEAKYRNQVAEPIRRALIAAKLEHTIACLVTTFGVPLRIESVAPDATVQPEIDLIRERITQSKAELREAVAQYRGVGADALPATAPAATQPAFLSLNRQIQETETAATEAVARLNATTTSDRVREVHQFLELYRRTHGSSALRNLKSLTGNDIAAEVERVLASERPPQADPHATNPAAARVDASLQRREVFGLIGYSRQLDATLHQLLNDTTHASLDSELMMLWLAPYPLEMWQTNPACLGRGALTRERMLYPLMVSRLDGASEAKVIEMIDQSLQVEQQGLDGVVYLDARGLTANSGYKQFDDDLRSTARWLTENTTLKVVLENTPELLKAQDCPNAALYCGWYALRRYHDSCQWLPGAVGYHVASSEMVSLHDPNEKGWVVGLLNHGICGTLGAVHEPYLDAFPRPSLFFPMLLSGRYTQAEVYYLTCPYTSWCIGYVGDPFYNPFKAKPRVTADQLAALGIPPAK